MSNLILNWRFGECIFRLPATGRSSRSGTTPIKPCCARATRFGSGSRGTDMTTERDAAIEAAIEAGLPYYSEGGCAGLAGHERREVVEAIVHVAIAAYEAHRSKEAVAAFETIHGRGVKMASFRWMEGDWWKALPDGKHPLYLHPSDADVKALMIRLRDLCRQPNPTDPTRWDVAPGKHRDFCKLLAEIDAALKRPADRKGGQ